MKKICALLAISLLFFLIACSGKASEEEVIENVLHSPREVNQYSATFEIDTTDLVKTVRENREVILTEDPIAKHEILTMEADGNKTTMNTYRVDNEIYTQEADDSPWVKREAAEDESLFEPSYKDVVSVLESVIDYAEFNSEGGTYTFRFDGFEREIYEAFEGPFNILLGGADIADEDMSLDFTFEVDKSNYYIENLEYNLSVENETGQVDINIRVAYDNMNDIDEIEVPEEVIEEAS
ncbi:DUF6612 family protein [Oceanobacillus sp. J11TS1]|uniref:DUF6612 family protein n=1 Tax=Oceanobacillus sp. J11TS1 TaxID=2807191 RepID=UPI001B020C07|nr:DUF6612 family protein [Oceanobacillus sp. J11TS1]GIO24160.1 hypothetical protein J11TS1_27410 [Oceanobacillus sp. J11TS1]